MAIFFSYIILQYAFVWTEQLSNTVMMYLEKDHLVLELGINHCAPHNQQGLESSDIDPHRRGVWRILPPLKHVYRSI